MATGQGVGTTAVTHSLDEKSFPVPTLSSPYLLETGGWGVITLVRILGTLKFVAKPGFGEPRDQDLVNGTVSVSRCW